MYRRGGAGEMAGNGMSAREVRGKDAGRGETGGVEGEQGREANQHRQAAHVYADFFSHSVSVSHPTANGWTC